jgi:hypothetical protein
MEEEDERILNVFPPEIKTLESEFVMNGKFLRSSLTSKTIFPQMASLISVESARNFFYSRVLPYAESFFSSISGVEAKASVEFEEKDINDFFDALDVKIEIVFDGKAEIPAPSLELLKSNVSAMTGVMEGYVDGYWTPAATTGERRESSELS